MKNVLATLKSELKANQLLTPNEQSEVKGGLTFVMTIYGCIPLPRRPRYTQPTNPNPKIPWTRV
jgi:hypothetical protein